MEENFNKEPLPEKNPENKTKIYFYIHGNFISVSSVWIICAYFSRNAQYFVWYAFALCNYNNVRRVVVLRVQPPQKYYKRYAKLKRTVESVSAQREETKAQLSYLNSINSHIYAGESLCDFEETEEELKALGLITAILILPPFSS